MNDDQRGEQQRVRAVVWASTLDDPGCPATDPAAGTAPQTFIAYRDEAWPTAEQLAAAWVYVDGPELIAANPDAGLDQGPWGRRLLAAERDRPAGCGCQHIVTLNGAQLARVVDPDCRTHGDDAVRRGADFPAGCTCAAVVRDSDRPDDPDPQRVTLLGCAVHGEAR